MGTGKRRSRKICAHRKKGHKDSKGGAQELQARVKQMLRNYRATPHSTTRVAPATALFGRPMKTKLPEVTTPCSDAAIRQRDQAAKAKIKEHADNKQYVEPSAIKEGTLYWSREMRQRRKVTHRITRYRGLSSRPKGLWSLQKMLKVSLLREILRSLRACPTSRNPVKGKRTPTLMVRRRSSMVRLRDATPSVREHAQPSLQTIYVLD